MANSAGILFLVTLFGLIFQGSDGVKDVVLEGPRYARRGEDLALRCSYDLETDSLYAVKWYRGSEEFYRFLPKEAPPKQAFPISGVAVDVNKSDDHSVFLRNISFETNGRFKCVISAEGTFQTLENAKDIEVIVIDYNSPKLSLDKMGYEVGERGVANCSVENTYPAPNITWFINGKQVHLSVMTRVVPVSDPPPPPPQQRPRQRKGGRGGGGGVYTTPNSAAGLAVSTTGSRVSSSATPTAFPAEGSGGKKEEGSRKLSSSVSTLTFPVQSYSPLTIKCTGSLHDVYNETSSILIQPKAPMKKQQQAPGYPNNNPTLSTPRSQGKYGLPNQLHTFNQTSSATPTNFDGAQLLPRTLLFLVAGLISAAAAQLPPK